jgi:hypothetical protein
VVADHSRSTRCGVDALPEGVAGPAAARGNVLIAHAVARAIATIGMSAVFFQDSFGMITFQGGFEQLQAIRPRVGKNQVIHCLDAYQYEEGLEELRRLDSLSGSLAGFLRKTSLVPVVSDFLFDDIEPVLAELAHVNVQHDVFLVIVDATFAYRLPSVSAGWVEAVDVETGQARVVSRRQLNGMADRVRGWQDEVAVKAKQAGLDVLRLDLDDTKSDIALAEFAVERRLRKR